ncbi:Dabb family protein [Salmonella enterica subsp. enterica serovar Chester]
MIRHLLLMKFNSDIPIQKISEIRDVFLSVSDKIPGILSVEWGGNNSSEGKASGFTHCVTMVFMDEFTRGWYLSHTEHFVLKNFRLFLADIIAFDYQFGSL